jgi:hypothetical protein
MNDLLLPLVGLFLLTRIKPQETTTTTPTGPTEPTGPTQPQRTARGTVIRPWPQVLNSQTQFNDLWKSGGTYGMVNGVFVEFFGPAAMCQWPQKYQYKNKINGLYAYLKVKVREYTQTPINNERLRDDLSEQIFKIKTEIQKEYNALKVGCMTYAPGSSGAAITTLPPTPKQLQP